jgi:hypothetical protein
MYNRFNDRKCLKQNTNQYEQCKNHLIPSCSNVYGIDGWPASTPQQSNVTYTNGISGSSPPNGFKQYLQPMYLYNYKEKLQLFKPHHRFEYEEDITVLKSGKTFYTINDVKYVFIEDLVGTHLRLLNILGIYRSNNKMMIMG